LPAYQGRGRRISPRRGPVESAVDSPHRHTAFGCHLFGIKTFGNYLESQEAVIAGRGYMHLPRAILPKEDEFTARFRRAVPGEEEWEVSPGKLQCHEGRVKHYRIYRPRHAR
jgi:hypothetical protein